MDKRRTRVVAETIDETGRYERKEGGGRLRSVRVEEITEDVQERVLSQLETPATHMISRRFASDLGVSRANVRSHNQKDIHSNPF